MERFLDSFLNPRLIAETWPAILKGLAVTIEIAALVVVSGLALGLALALLRWRAGAWLTWPLMFFVDLFRAVPPLVDHFRAPLRRKKLASHRVAPSRAP